MDVLLTPSICINVSTNPAYVGDSAQDNHAVCLFPQNEGSFWVGSGLGIHTNDESSDRSSSIGTREKSGDEDEDEDDDASSKSDETHSSSGLGSMGSLEESLPVKRGLSNHFSGKSKSFVNLTEASSVSDLPKTENPLNKRRRMLIASKWSRKSSFYGWSNSPISMPLLALDEDERKADQSSSDEKEPEEEEEEDDDDKKENNGLSQKLSKLYQSKRRRSFKSRSCFSLADL